MKLAVIGGGSRFVLNVAHGLDLVLPDGATGRYEVALFDTDAARAEGVAAYAGALVARRGLPARFRVCRGREEALDGASHVLVSIGIHEADRASHRAIETYGFPRHSVHDGPTSILTAVEAAPVFLETARAMRQRCPDALMINLVNPTDILADLACRAAGIRTAGMCVEVPLWLDSLAYYLGHPPGSLWARYGGVNHEGWIAELRVGGADGPPVTREQVLALRGHPDLHILHAGALDVYELTGMLMTSGGHYWQFSDYEIAGAERFWKQTYPARKRPADEKAARAIEANVPLAAEEVRGGHPISDAPLNFMGLGVSLAQWMRAFETGEPARFALQVPNAGADGEPLVANWPAQCYVEVPTVAQGEALEGELIGELPDVPCGLTMLGAWQRRLAADFLVDGQRSTARAALAATANLATVDRQLAFADELVARRIALLGAGPLR